MNSHRMLALFIAEGRDLLQRVDAGLTELARAPSDGAHLDAVFRAVHSLKGMSATVGLADITAALHAAETLLATARDLRELAPAHARVLLSAADALRAALDAAERGDRQPASLAALAQELASLTACPAAAAALPRRDAARLVHHATRVEGARWRVDVRVTADAAIPSARATVIARRVARLATVLAATPDAEARTDDHWDREFSLWLGAAVPGVTVDAEAIEAAVRGAGEVAECQVIRDIVAPGVDVARAVAMVRIPASRLDDLLDLVGELVLARDRIVRTFGPCADAAGQRVLDDASRLVVQLRDAILSSRMVPLSEVLDRFPRHVRDTAAGLGKDVDLVLEGRELEVDRSLLDELSDPLLHLLRNAVDHGLETPEERRHAGKSARGRLVVRAAREGAVLAVTVADDGRGVDREKVAERATAQGVAGADLLAQDDQGLLQLLARPGLSTALQVTALSGRGVGVDAVLNRAHALGGRLDLATAAGAGTAITLRLPLSVAVLRALLVQVAGETYAIPLGLVTTTQLAAPHRTAAGVLAAAIEVNGSPVRTVSLRAHLGLPPADDVSGQLVVLDGAGGRVALHVDACTAQQEIVVKPLQKVRGAASTFSGGTILPDGTPSLILDINSLP
jgi:two-component system chemotaxis sensor kinase CheA